MPEKESKGDNGDDRKRSPSNAPANSGSSTSFKSPLTPTEPTKVILLPSVLVFTSSLASYFVGRYNYSILYALGAGLLVVFSIMTLRDKITQAAKVWADRQAKRKACVREDESAEWINATLYRFWQFYEPVLSAQIKESMEESMKNVKPPGLTGISVSRFTLGKIPPYISSVRFLLKDGLSKDISESRIVLNLGLGIQAPDLEVVVAAKTAGASLPVAVKDIYFEGKMRIEIDLIPQFPHAKTVMVTFLEKPIFDFQIVPLKSVSITEIPGLAQMLSGLIHDAIDQNVVNPERIVIPLMEQAGGQINPNEGLIDCMVHSVEYEEQKHKNPLMHSLDKTPQELYCVIKLGKSEVHSEKTFPLQKKNKHYKFESRHLLLSERSDTDMFQVQVMSKNKVTQQSRLIGKIFFSVLEIRQAKEGNSPIESLVVDFEGETEGKVILSLDWLSLGDVKATDKEDQEDDGKEIKDTVVVSPHNVAPAPKGQSGTIYLHVHEAFDLHPLHAGSLNSLVRVYYTDKRVIKSRVIENSTCPVFDVSTELTCGDLSKVKLTLRVQDGHQGLGDLDLDLESLFYEEESNSYNYTMLRQWFTLRAPGPITKESEKEKLNKLKEGEKTKTKSYGRVQLSILFRPFDLNPHLEKYIPLFDVGNAGDNLNLTCYDLSHGVVHGVEALGSGMVHGVGAVGSGMVHGVGAVGSGMAHGVGGMVHGVGSGMGKLMHFGSHSKSDKKKSEDGNVDAEAGNPIDLSNQSNSERQRRGSFGRMMFSK